MDLVVVDAQIAPVEESLVSAPSYHVGMTAERLADRFTQYVSHNESPLRRSWFFMHIAKVAVSDRILKGCELRMTKWSYRDPLLIPNLTTKEGRKRDKALSSKI